jgi:hypothetical protein
MRAIRYLGAKRMHHLHGSLEDLPFDKRLKRLRRSRRRMLMQRLTDNVLWLVLFAALGAVVATELVVALAKA